MAITRMTLDALKTRSSKRDRAKPRATTEADIPRQMVEDGENPDANLCGEDIISPWYIRTRLALTQQRFADTLGLPVATLQNREQNRVMMEPATVALMRILAHETKPALRACGRRAA